MLLRFPSPESGLKTETNLLERVTDSRPKNIPLLLTGAVLDWWMCSHLFLSHLLLDPSQGPDFGG